MALPEMKVRITSDTASAEAGLDRVVHGANQVGSATDRMAARVAGASRQLAVTQRRSSAAGRGFQNLGFQINDFAVQTGAGTAASVALSQQLPQLLQGFGLLGVALSVVVAAGIPLAKMFSQASSGGKVTSDIFGSLEPVVLSLADGIKSLRATLADAFKTIGENLDRILTTGGAVAAFFLGKWVVGAIAARVATMSVTVSLVALRAALIRTGFGAAAVLLGEFVYQLISANSWLRNLLVKLDIIRASSIEELKVKQAALNEELEASNASLTKMIALQKERGTVAAGVIQESIDYEKSEQESIKIKLAGINAEIAGYKELADAKSRTLVDFGTGKDKDKDKAKKDADEREEQRKKELQRQRENLEKGLNAIRNSQLTERQELFKHLLDKRAILDEAFEQDLVTDTERKQLMRDLLAEHNDALAEIDQEKRDEDAAKKGADFQRIYDLTKGNLSDQLGAWGGYFQNLASLTGSSNNKMMAALKAFGAAEALINAWRSFNQVLADPTLPWFAKVAAAGQVLAAGIGAVNAIQSATSGGGGKKSAGGGGGEAAAAPPSPLNVRLSGIGASDFISGGQLGTLLDRLDDEAGDRGYRLMVAA